MAGNESGLDVSLLRVSKRVLTGSIFMLDCVCGIGKGLLGDSCSGSGGLIIISPQLPLLVPGDVSVVADDMDGVEL
jgi:hypothetical protein